MKITAVEPVVLGLPLERPVRTSFGAMTHRYAILVRVETDAGLTGWGESWSNFPSWSPYERVRTIRDGIAPLVLGEDPRQVRELHRQMVEGTRRLALQWGAPGPLRQAISAVDIALWDILGKERGLPVYRLIEEMQGGPAPGSATSGHAPRAVPVYASGLGPDEPSRLAEPLLRAGVTAHKLKVGFGSERDRRNLAELRDLIGPDGTLLTDANQAWDLPTALEMLKLLEPYAPHWLEEPLPADQTEEMAQLRQAASCRIVAGENAYGAEGFRRLLDAGAVDLVQPDLCKTGGITEGIAICQLAGARGIGYAPHYLGGAVGLIATLHLCAAVPGLWRLELDANPNPLRSELGGGLLTVKDGCLTVPQGPGLGLDLPAALVDRYLLHIG